MWTPFQLVGPSETKQMFMSCMKCFCVNSLGQNISSKDQRRNLNWPLFETLGAGRRTASGLETCGSEPRADVSEGAKNFLWFMANRDTHTLGRPPTMLVSPGAENRRRLWTFDEPSFLLHDRLNHATARIKPSHAEFSWSTNRTQRASGGGPGPVYLQPVQTEFSSFIITDNELILQMETTGTETSWPVNAGSHLDFFNLHKVWEDTNRGQTSSASSKVQQEVRTLFCTNLRR